MIPNSSYEAAPPLPNPPRDAALVANALARAGFQVIPLPSRQGRVGLTKAEFDAVLKDFKHRADTADIALIYYAGHAIELAGHNWLLPIDTRLKTVTDIDFEGVSLDTLLAATGGARTLRMIVLDACRDNPFALQFGSDERGGPSRGLGHVTGLPLGTVVIYSASKGQEASDGPKYGNSPFAIALARRLAEPGIEINFTLRRVHDDVFSAQQEPDVMLKLRADPIYLIPPVPATVSERGAEVAAFEAAAKQSSAAGWRAFLARFPSGTYQAIARQLLASFTGGTSVAPASAGSVDPIARARGALAAITPDQWSVLPASRIIAQLFAEAAPSAMRQLAESGDATAQWAIGMAYYQGQFGFAKDATKAVAWVRKSAARGNLRGQLALGFFYHNGDGGLPKDQVAAVKLYQTVAAAGIIVADVNLGAMYEDGAGGLLKDAAEATRLYRIAADHGSAVGQSNLGLMYQRGIGGLPLDEREAVKLYKLAAAQGWARGQTNLGFMYAMGTGGLPENKDEAVRLYKLAADQGDDLGINNLGVMYETGQGGLPVDRAAAIRLYTAAAAAGNALAKNNLARLQPSH